MNKDDINMSNENEIINLNPKVNGAQYKNLSREILAYKDETGDFIKDMLDKIQKISLFIKKIKLEEDSKYFETQSKEYVKLLGLAKMKIEKLLIKCITWTAKKSDKDREIDIRHFDTITDFVDDLLEKCSDNIDILKGKKKDKKEADIEEELKNIKQMNENKKKKIMSTMKMLNTTDLFDIDNSYYPFIPKIKTKHFPIKELSADIEDARRLRNQNLEKFSQIRFEARKEIKDNMTLFEHPYREEIVTIVNNLADRMDIFNNYIKREYFTNPNANRGDCSISFKLTNISDLVNQFGLQDTIKKIKEMNKFYNFFFYENISTDDTCKCLLEQVEFEYPPLEWTKLVYIDTPEALIAMIDDIEQNYQEIAVDLEHHSLESYLGVTCLMQISTRLQDYVIDTIKIRQHMQEINRIFCNPAIVKVFHGADFDIEWLQKDFGVYVVNMFDTGQASRVLMLPSFSLANLLNTFCNISADKKYQLADWRIRPLPAEMLKYAREDTHYLLYIYDVLRKKLTYKSFMKNEDVMTQLLLTFKKSNEICLKQYAKPAVKSQEYYQLLGRNITVLNKRNISILKIFYKFRDYVGRKLDLNPHHVLSNKNMFTLLRLPGNKFDMETIYQNLDKNSHIRNFVPDLVKLIEAKLKKNDEAIDKGQVSKFLEKSYIDNIKEKFGESKSIVKNLKLSNENKINMSTVNISNKSEKKIGDNVEGLKKEDVVKAGEDISFKVKKSSKFIEEKENTFNQNDSFNVSSSKMLLQVNSQHIEFNSMYNKVLENFRNFNIINFLKEKHPKLKNLKIEKKESGVGGAVKTEEKKLTNIGLKEAESVSVSNEESLLKQKRKGPDHSEHIDLTDYKRVNLFKPPQEYSESDEEISVEEENNEPKKYNKIKNSQIKTLNSIQAESVKNMLASAKFLKEMANKSKKK